MPNDLAERASEEKESHVQSALRHVWEGRERIKRQGQIIAGLRAHRRPTDEAESVLDWLVEQQIAFETHYKGIIRSGREKRQAAGYKDPTADWPRD